MITIQPLKGDFKNGYVVFGHAGFGERGQDIVCAAVSGITQMATFSLVDAKYATYKMHDGYLEVSMLQYDDSSDFLINGMIKTLKALEEQYPENVKLMEGSKWLN